MPLPFEFELGLDVESPLDLDPSLSSNLDPIVPPSAFAAPSVDSSLPFAAVAIVKVENTFKMRRMRRTSDVGMAGVNSCIEGDADDLSDLPTETYIPSIIFGGDDWLGELTTGVDLQVVEVI
jgi:hypothetical protein